jgi:hypothetical protein
VAQIDPVAAQAEYDAAMASKPTDDAGFLQKQRALDRARTMLGLRRG